MKKHLKEIETAGIVMLLLGVIVAHTVSIHFGATIVAVGMLLWVVTVVVKALDWKTYRRDNLVNICIMLGAIIMLFISYLRLAH